jgi:phage shock protein PspC (stress-responsive transcriptional regulator)
MNTTAPETEETTAAPAADDAGPGPVPLSRPLGDRMLAGVASGVARYLGIDPLLVRLGFVVLVFVGGLGIPLYLASWLLIPEEGADQSIAAEFVHNIQGWRS